MHVRKRAKPREAAAATERRAGAHARLAQIAAGRAPTELDVDAKAHDRGRIPLETQRHKVRERWVAQLAGGSRPWPKPEFAGLESRRHQEEASAADVAGLYRQLRKGREEAKDEPGAADFYYGEAEMRRHARETPAGERVILWMYWLTSGYGLRASRALIALAITVVLFALAFDLWGLDRQPFWRALLLSAQSTTSLFRPPSRPALTAEGEALQLVLRLLGPLFFGLALLSLRGRVKR